MNNHTHNEEREHRASASGSGIAQDKDPRSIEASLYRLAARTLRLQLQCKAAGYEHETELLHLAIVKLTAAAYALSERETR